MGEEFYCILKLVSGEEILSLISSDENDGDTILILQNPVVIKIIHSSDNSSYLKVHPWMELSNEDMFIINLDKVITMTETDDEKLLSIYKNYLSSDIEVYKPGGEVKVSNEMGYISSVESARKNLEDIFNDKKER
jgi:hypothetical protein